MPRLTIGGRPIRMRGHFAGGPGRLEAAMWRQLFVLCASLDPPPDVLVAARDTDGEPERVIGFEQARSDAMERGNPMALVLAAPHRTVEAWFVAGFVPKNPAERARLDARRRLLSFDPTAEPHRLGTDSTAPSDAKRTLRWLVWEEEVSASPPAELLPDLCTRTLADLGRLRRVGEATGLCAFLQSIEVEIVPRLIGSQAR